MHYEIFSKPGCTHCDNAKTLLNSIGLAYVEYILDIGQVKEVGKNYFTAPALQKRVPGCKTVPQIFFGSTLIGGFDALKKHLNTP